MSDHVVVPSKRLRKEDSFEEEQTKATAPTFPMPAGALPPASGLRTAVDVMSALSRVDFASSIGYWRTKEARMHGEMKSYGPPDYWEDSSEEPEEPSRSAEELKDTQLIFKELSGIHKDFTRTQARGKLSAPFRLRVTRKSCEFDAPIDETLDDDALQQLLQRWYDHSDVAGYGDVQAQETKVDPEVRDAHEIPASEFAVEPELLGRIQHCWDEHFPLNKGVRVEPYKINLYGPGGHFKTHRDTPQKDLVGTFVLGLGDTSSGSTTDAYPCRWRAFFPDVPHSVDTYHHGYRATLAFKLFRVATGAGPQWPPDAQAAVLDVLSRLSFPCGILLSRKYCLGTTTLSGLDAFVFGSACARPDIDVKLLPVVSRLYATWGSTNRDYCYEDYAQECSCEVFPFSEDHIDVLLGRRGEKELARIYPWLSGLKDIPFFSADVEDAAVVWRDEMNETCNYVGNEAQAWRQDSVYLSYALLLLPKRAQDSNPDAA